MSHAQSTNSLPGAVIVDCCHSINDQQKYPASVELASISALLVSSSPNIIISPSTLGATTIPAKLSTSSPAPASNNKLAVPAEPTTLKRPKFWRILALFHPSQEFQATSLDQDKLWSRRHKPKNPDQLSKNDHNSGDCHENGSRHHHIPRLSRFFDFFVPKGRLVPMGGSGGIGEELQVKKSLSPLSTKKLAKNSLSDDEVELLRDQLPAIKSIEELEFSQKYRFIGTKVIGRGASGVVRLACCNSCTDKKLAVKEFRKRRKDESPAEYLRKLTSEFCIASRLHHCNVVETIDIVHDGSKWYEVMEYCPGGDLFTVIQGGELGVDEVDCCFRQLVEGAHYIHTLGIAHRDLKPENLLIDARGHLKITDFGVSDVFSVESEAGRPAKSRGVCGSSPYIAPEEYLSDEYDGRLVDVWSIGIIYYAMIFHTVPWESASLKDPNYRHYIEYGPTLFEPFRRLPYGPRQLLIRILEPDPSKRITIEEIMQDPWFQRIQSCVIPGAHDGELENRRDFLAR